MDVRERLRDPDCRPVFIVLSIDIGYFTLMFYTIPFMLVFIYFFELAD